MTNEMNINEITISEMQLENIRETIKVGKRALNSLYAAKSKLEATSDWGVLDMLGGGLLTTAVKYSKMDEASLEIEAAKRDLQRFQLSLRDVQASSDINIEIDRFLSFADFIFDGLIVDSLAQSRISDAKRQVADAIFKVERIIKSLQAQIAAFEK